MSHHTEEQFREVNVAGTRAVLEAAREDPGCRAVVHCSTTSLLINQRVVEAERAGHVPWLDEEDGHAVPTRNNYGRSKQQAEKLCREFCQDVARLTVLRLPRCFPEDLLQPSPLLLVNVKANSKYKLAYLVVASKYKGHGTAMSDLKKKHGIPESDPCNNGMVDFLCDCPKQAAVDLDSKTICIGHPCFGVTTVKSLKELGQEEENTWFKVFGCKLGRHCPRGYCTHVRGITGLDAEYIKKLPEELDDKTDLRMELEDIPDIDVWQGSLWNKTQQNLMTK